MSESRLLNWSRCRVLSSLCFTDDDGIGCLHVVMLRRRHRYRGGGQEQ